MKRNDKILLVAVVIALFTLAYSPARADLEASKINLCHVHEKVAQLARNMAIQGSRSMIISYLRANYTGWERDVNLKVARWGFMFYTSTSEQLKEAFLEACLSSTLGAINMPEVDNR